MYADARGSYDVETGLRDDRRPVLRVSGDLVEVLRSDNRFMRMHVSRRDPHQMIMEGELGEFYTLRPAAEKACQPCAACTVHLASAVGLGTTCIRGKLHPSLPSDHMLNFASILPLYGRKTSKGSLPRIGSWLVIWQESHMDHAFRHLGL